VIRRKLVYTLQAALIIDVAAWSFSIDTIWMDGIEGGHVLIKSTTKPWRGKVD
jgi:hypothetical protein